MLEVKELGLNFKGQPVLSGLNLHFQLGKLYALLGPNGAGKTSLLKLLNRTWTPSTGVILWKNTPLHELSRQEVSQILSLVPQETQSAFAFTVTDFVGMGAYALDKQASGGSLETRIIEALKIMDALNLKDRKITELSAGEKKRAYIARALLTHSPVLLLDEPTANLDIAHKLKLWSLLKRFAEEGRTIVVSTHDLELCKHFCDEAFLLKKGHCVAKGSIDEVLCENNLKETFCVTHNHGEWQPLI